MLEEVKKLTHPECYKWFKEGCPFPQNPACPECEKQAHQICQLFEPKPDKQKLEPAPRFDEVYSQGVNNMDKLDESRLLTDYELYFRGYNIHCRTIYKKHIFEAITKAQDAKTASIKDKECQARVERILGKFERSRALDGSMWWRVMPEDEWQALREGIEEAK